MKQIIQFIPSIQAIIIGIGVGIATNNIAIGIVLTIIFSFVFRLKPIKY